VITLNELKQALRVRHDYDDELLTHILAGATDECLQFMNLSELPIVADTESPPSETGPIPASIRSAVYLLAEASYDKMRPDEVDLRRKRAEQLCMPYRAELGV
jgi:hypothetical protein